MKGAFILLTVVCTAFAVPSCPKENPTGEDVLLSAEDCQHFYKCDHGKAYLMACPKNEEWSQELKRCDWPEIAQCTSSTGPKPTSSPSPTQTTPVSKPTTPAYVTCPQENPIGEDVLLPAKDCQHFYKCDHGIPYLMPCPPNQEWSQELKRCDWPEIAQCTSSTGTKPTSSPSPIQTTPVSKPTTPAYVTCPQENPIGEDVLLPAKDCQHFYKCDHGIPYLMPCPPNQEWSQELKRCDWPEIAQCTSSTGTEPTSSPSDNTSPTQTTPVSKPTTPANPSNICPTGNESETFVPIPGVCDKFYKCDFGIPQIENCPLGTQFSHSMLRCDFPENANCEEGVTGMKN